MIFVIIYLFIGSCIGLYYIHTTKKFKELNFDGQDLADAGLRYLGESESSIRDVDFWNKFYFDFVPWFMPLIWLPLYGIGLIALIINRLKS